MEEQESPEKGKRQQRTESEPDPPNGYVHIRNALRAVLMTEHYLACGERGVSIRRKVADSLNDRRRKSDSDRKCG